VVVVSRGLLYYSVFVTRTVLCIPRRAVHKKIFELVTTNNNWRSINDANHLSFNTTDFLQRSLQKSLVIYSPWGAGGGGSNLSSRLYNILNFLK
jgi:hypothetical protein